VEKVGMPNTGIVQLAIRLRYFLKHKLKDPEERRRRKPSVSSASQRGRCSLVLLKNMIIMHISNLVMC
jgi:hypothetical protein